MQQLQQVGGLDCQVVLFQTYQHHGLLLPDNDCMEVFVADNNMVGSGDSAYGSLGSRNTTL